MYLLCWHVCLLYSLHAVYSVIRQSIYRPIEVITY